MQAAIYARVSTDEQATKGYSIPSQIEACHRYAEEHNLTVIVEMTDDYSGTKLDRPGLSELRELVITKVVDSIIVFNSDRWTRNLAHSLILREELLSFGVELHFVNRGKSEDTPEHRMTENIEAVFNEYWREKIIEASKRGKQQKAKAGKIVMPAYPTYGYKKDGDRLVKDAEALQIVQRIVNWYLRGDKGKKPFSLVQIAKELNSLGILTPQHTRGAGPHWSPTQVRRILKDEIYAGIYYYGKTRMVDGKQVKRAKEEWIKIEVPELAIYGLDTYQKIQDCIEKNKRLSNRNKKNLYLLSGFVRCGNCGRGLAGHLKSNPRGSYTSYVCNDVGWRRPPRCEFSYKSIATHFVDDAAWGWIVGLLQDDEGLDEGIRKLIEKRKAQIEPKRQEIDSAAKLVKKADVSIQRLAAALKDEDNPAVISAIKAEMRTEAKNREALVKSINSLEVEIYRVEITPEIESQIREMVRGIRKHLVNPTFEQKRQLLDFLNFEGKLIYDDGRRFLKVFCGLVPDEETIELRSRRSV
jgi:site-specific DNA recombinase